MSNVDITKFFEPANNRVHAEPNTIEPSKEGNSLTYPTSEWSLLEAALAYARLGWAVLPLHSVSNGKCSCGKTNCGGPGKRPWTDNGVSDATTDPGQITKWWTKWPDANIGLATGSPSRRVVLDVDIKKGKRGDESLESLVQEHGFLPRTLTNQTQSGGWHFIFRLPSSAMGTPLGVRSGIDILVEGRYIVAPPSSNDGKVYECVVPEAEADCPDWLVELSREGNKNSLSSVGDIPHLIRELLPHGEEHNGEWKTNCPFHDDKHPSFGVRLKDGIYHCFACSAGGDFVSLYAQIKQVTEKVAKQTLRNILIANYMAELNRSHAVVRIQGKVPILNEEVDPEFGWKDFSLSSSFDLKLLYVNRKFPGQGKRENVADLWLKYPERREYKGIVFSPKRNVSGYYNLWQGFAVEPKEGDCSLFLNHIRDNLAQKNDTIYQYILAWMADIVQRPDQRPGVSLVLRGKQGTGKGIFCWEFGSLFGPHFLHVPHSQHLVGNFNAHLKNALLVFADEAFWAGDRSHEGPLKAMITEKKLPIEFKGKDVVWVKNHIHLLVASNHEWVVPAGPEERRFFVLDVSEQHMQDHEYFNALSEQMENGGREALLHYLLDYDLSGVNLRQFPQTEALLEQKLHTMGSVEKFWYECLMEGRIFIQDGRWNSWVIRHALHDAYVQHAKMTGERRRSTETKLGKGLHKLVPGLHKGEHVE